MKTFTFSIFFYFSLQSCAIIEVTDGWYSIRAMLDRPLTRLLHDKKIAVGQKLFVYGAELIGSEQAVSPLEVHLCLHGCGAAGKKENGGGKGYL